MTKDTTTCSPTYNCVFTMFLFFDDIPSDLHIIIEETLMFQSNTVLLRLTLLKPKGTVRLTSNGHLEMGALSS